MTYLLHQSVNFRKIVDLKIIEKTSFFVFIISFYTQKSLLLIRNFVAVEST